MAIVSFACLSAAIPTAEALRSAATYRTDDPKPLLRLAPLTDEPRKPDQARLTDVARLTDEVRQSYAQFIPTDMRRSKRKQAKRSDNVVRPSKSASGSGDVDTWAIFGFIEGSDSGAKGDKYAFSDTVIRSRAVHRFGIHQNIGLAYGVNDRLTIWGAGIRSFAGANPPDVTEASNAGMLVGWKYRLVPRQGDSLGLSFHGEPYWERSVARHATVRQSVGADFRLIADKMLSPDQLFGAINISYQPQTLMIIDGTTEKESGLEIGGAVSGRVSQSAFIGGELRYVRSFTGYFFDQTLAWAVFVGPTLYTTIGTNGYLGVSWSTQILGKSTDGARAVSESASIEKHQVRFKFGFAL